MRTTLALSLLLAVACRKPQDADGDGVADGVDCTPTAAPTAEICDGIDNDCNGAVDDGATGGPLWNADVDHDGYGDPVVTTSACVEPPGHTDNGEDCDDADPAAHPGAAEPGCDGTVDLNCDGVVGIVDDDEDGFSTCEDCDDDNNSTFPGAAELCNDRDDDCDGAVDNDADDAEDYAIDVDADGHGSTVFLVAACEVPAGYVPALLADDCDDLDDRTYPGAAEDCDGTDNDCDGTIDDGAQGKGAYYEDADEDGYGDADTEVLACVRPAGYVSNFDDCNDGNKGINPAANEACSDVQDRNCDGAVGNDDNDGDGTVACDDCDDGRADVEPGAPELCDGVDNDCDTLIDESAPLWYADLDGDKHGNTQLVVVACEAPNGYVASFDDCDDFDKAAYPGATETCDGADTNCDSTLMTGEDDADGDGFLACADDCDDDVATRSPLGLELCNGIDDDCDGSTDEPGAVDEQTWYADADADKYGTSSLTKSACTPPAGYVGNDRDCNDLTNKSYPGNTETCDSADNDCDGEIDEGSPSSAPTWYADGDGDGYGGVIAQKACTAPAGFVSKGLDCDDGDAKTYPTAGELCNGLDDNCDGAVPSTETDGDNDGVRACSDCNDGDAQIRPGAVELCNSKDDNCDTKIDENAANANTFYTDGDGDKYGLTGSTTRACGTAPTGFSAVAGDCNDASATTYPGAAEVCDKADHDCDGHIDFDEDGDGYAANWCGGKDCNDNNKALPDSKGNCFWKDCQDAYVNGSKTDGTYTIDYDGAGTGLAEIDVHCDMTNGGWTLCASLTKGFVPSDMLYNAQRYAYQARLTGVATRYVYEREAPGRSTSTWDNAGVLNYGQFCRWLGSGPAQTRIEAKLYNYADNNAANIRGNAYNRYFTGVYTGNLFTQWMTNSGASRSFSRVSGDTLSVLSNSNGYGGPYTTPNVSWTGTTDAYTHSTPAWGSVPTVSSTCVGCTGNGGAYSILMYGGASVLNDKTAAVWSGIPNIHYGWSDCTANGNCNYHESGYGVWLFWMR